MDAESGLLRMLKFLIDVNNFKNYINELLFIILKPTLPNLDYHWNYTLIQIERNG